MSETTTTSTEKWIIPCGGAKADTATAARDLYTGNHFSEALATALANVPAEQVFILSAKYGLLALDTVVAPYDVKMGDVESISPAEVAVQAIRFGFDFETRVQAFLPQRYLAVLTEACEWIGCEVWDTYEADAGIGYQKGTLKSVRSF